MKTKTICTLLFCSISTKIFCDEDFKISGKLLHFESKKEVLVYCREKTCMALSAFEKSKLHKAPFKDIPEKKYKSSLGSDFCHYALHGKSILGRASNQDGRAFCYFKDHSMIEINSLSAYLKKKD
ncbi:MAG: hypothetical protein ACXVLQ_12700 [Bacteriovorax sp.]